MPPEPIVASYPIVIVGQPCSGSTILTRLINEDPSVFVVNDFNVLQKIYAENLWEPLSSDEAFRIAEWVYRILEIRCTQEIGKTLEHPNHLTLENLGEVKQFVCAQWPDFLLWSDVLRMVFEHAARCAGATRWGWSAPQDYQYLNRIFANFPQAKIVCQLRKPDAVLASCKNVDGWGYDARRYNPVMLAYAWKKAAANTEHWLREKPEQFLFLRYEDLVGETPTTRNKLAGFLELNKIPNSLGELKKNSLMKGKRPRKNITGLESRVTLKICAEVAEGLGFQPVSKTKIKARDFVEALIVVKNSAWFLFSDYLLSNVRRRYFVNQLFRH